MNGNIIPHPGHFPSWYTGTLSKTAHIFHLFFKIWLTFFLKNDSISIVMRMWRNGRRSRLKICRPQSVRVQVPPSALNSVNLNNHEFKFTLFFCEHIKASLSLLLRPTNDIMYKHNIRLQGFYNKKRNAVSYTHLRAPRDS